MFELLEGCEFPEWDPEFDWEAEDDVAEQKRVIGGVVCHGSPEVLDFIERALRAALGR